MVKLTAHGFDFVPWLAKGVLARLLFCDGLVFQIQYTSDTAIRDLLTEILSPKFLSRGSMKQFSSLIAVSFLRGDQNEIFFHEK